MDKINKSKKVKHRNTSNLYGEWNLTPNVTNRSLDSIMTTSNDASDSYNSVSTGQLTNNVPSCKHYAEVRQCSQYIISYCIKCGKILDVRLINGFTNNIIY